MDCHDSSIMSCFNCENSWLLLCFSLHGVLLAFKLFVNRLIFYSHSSLFNPAVTVVPPPFISLTLSAAWRTFLHMIPMKSYSAPNFTFTHPTSDKINGSALNFLPPCLSTQSSSKWIEPLTLTKPWMYKPQQRQRHKWLPQIQIFILDNINLRISSVLELNFLPFSVSSTRYIKCFRFSMYTASHPFLFMCQHQRILSLSCSI